jgi:predicted alpha/beta-hydrolase family hydrolase
MGGRIGTYLASEGYPCAGLVLYAYPLHPAGRPEQVRVDQFAALKVPMLFFQGTRDALARMELFEEHIAPLPNAEVVILEGASHSTRGGGWTESTMVDRLVTETLAWVRRLAKQRVPGHNQTVPAPLEE